MKTTLIEYIMSNHLDIRKNIIVPRVSWGLDIHECDLLSVTKAGYATEIEIKISKSDLLKDKAKRHMHIHHKIKYLYFAVPLELKEIALKNIPERAGLYVVYREDSNYRVRKEKDAVANVNARKLTNEEITKLLHLGVMRYWTKRQEEFDSGKYY